MSNWQFCQNDTDITSSPTAEMDATEVRLWDVSGELIIAAEYNGETWSISASDYYHQWTDFSECQSMSYQRAINYTFGHIKHDHEISETAEIRMRNGREYAVCDLCGIPCDLLDTE